MRLVQFQRPARQTPYYVNPEMVIAVHQLHGSEGRSMIVTAAGSEQIDAPADEVVAALTTP